MIDAKEYLNQVKLYNTHINNKLEEIARLENLAMNITAHYGVDIPSGGSGGDKIGNAIAKIVDLENEINDAIDVYIELKRAVGNSIDKLKNADQVAVLYKRYFEQKTWEQIASEMNYSYRNVCYIHGDALKAISADLSAKV